MGALARSKLRNARHWGARIDGSWRGRPVVLGWPGISVFALSLIGLVPVPAKAQSAPPAAPAQASEPAPAASTPPAEREEIIVNGVPPAENIMPTQRTNTSIYGLDLNVMQIPRNTTMLSSEQLQAVNIQDPRSFSYLTSSSYTDSAFGGPNVPRIRGQYGDIFYNGMRSGFTSTGYGGPLSFNSIETIDITKGPASVTAGPGPGVGGSANFITKRPGLQDESGSASFSVDSQDRHRWSFDYSEPVVPGELAWRLSYSGEQSGSYFYDHYFDQHALYGAVRWLPNDNYSIDFNTEAVVANYEENVGINRVNQQLINSGTYLRGQPLPSTFDSATGTYEQPGFSAFGGLSAYDYIFGAGSAPYPIGSKGNPFSPAYGILTEFVLGNPVKLNPRITIDETPGTSAHEFLYNAQLIQKYDFNDDVSIDNNTFFDYENRDNQAMYSYSDSAKGSFAIENRTELQLKYGLPVLGGADNGGLDLASETNLGVSARYTHINYIGNFNNEDVGVYDLTTNPALWYFAPSAQAAGDAVPYVSADGRIQYGVSGRDSTDAGNTVISDFYDVGLFIEHRVEFTPELSLLAGGRVDFVQNNAQDPLTPLFGTSLSPQHSTAWFALGNANVSPVYQFAPWGTFYLTYDYTQTVSSSAGDGALGTYGQVPDKVLLEQTSRLYEAGLKFDLLNKTLFAGTAVFRQERELPTGPSGESSALAKITGIEAEANYQPERHFFATVSYSFIRTILNSNPGFYNYPASPGLNVDGAGLFAVWQPNQHFDDPGVPQQVFNFLGNYRFDSGLGVRVGLQVTSPFDVTASGRINLAASSFVPQSVINAGGYYSAPRVPWQYTLNASVFYDIGRYEFKASIYNLTDQKNWEASYPFYGNDFILRADPIDGEVSVKVSF